MRPPGAAIRRSAAATIACSALLLAIAAQPPAADGRPLITGVTNIDSSEPLAFERTRASGAKLIRIPLHWDGTVPQAAPANWRPDDPSDPHYDWSKSDADVTRAVQAGLTPVLSVGGAPSWAERCRPPDSLPYWVECDPDPAAFGAFAAAAARRYSGAIPGLPRVSYWQALNEPNLSLFFFPQYETSGRAISPDLYRNLLNAFYAGVKSVNPSNQVLMAGLGPIAVPLWTIGPMSFARQLLCMRGVRRPRPTPGNCGGGVHFDIFAIQPYTTGGPTHHGKVNDVQLGDLGKLQTLLKAADRAKRIKGMFKQTPLWITEFSWDSQPPDPGGLPMKILTRWAAEALHEAWQAGVSRFLWYSLRDSAPSADQPFSETIESGLYFRGASLEQDKPKKVLKAFRFPFVAYPGSGRLSFWGRTPNSRGGKVKIQLQKGKRWKTVRVLRASKAGIFEGSVQTPYGRDKRGAARAVAGGQRALPFAMRPVKSFRHPPFG